MGWVATVFGINQGIGIALNCVGANYVLKRTCWRSSKEMVANRTKGHTFAEYKAMHEKIQKEGLSQIEVMKVAAVNPKLINDMTRTRNGWFINLFRKWLPYHSYIVKEKI